MSLNKFKRKTLWEYKNKKREQGESKMIGGISPNRGPSRSSRKGKVKKKGDVDFSSVIEDVDVEETAQPLESTKIEEMLSEPIEGDLKESPQGKQMARSVLDKLKDELKREK